MVGLVLDSHAVWDQKSCIPQTFKFLSGILCEAPFLGDNNLLSAWVLELCTSQSLNNLILVLLTDSH